MNDDEQLEVVWPLGKHHYIIPREPPVKDSVLDEYEDLALQGVRAMKEFLTYRGDNKGYLNRAKVGAVGVGAYARLRATIANEQQIKLIQERMVDDKQRSVPALPEAI